MAIMNITLPDPLKSFVDTQVQDRGYETASEYVRDLIRCDQLRQAEQHLATLMAEGLKSGPAIPVDTDYWNDKRSLLAQKHSNR